MNDALSAWQAIRVIAGREISVKLRDRAFIGSTVFMLVLVTAATLIPVLIQQRVPSVRVAVQGAAAAQVVERAAELGRQAQESGTSLPPALAVFGEGGLPSADISTVEVTQDGSVDTLVRNHDVDAALVGADLAHLTMLGAQGVPSELDVLVRAAASEIQVSDAATRAGLSPDQVTALTSPAMPVTVLLDANPTGEVPPQLLVLVFAFLFYLSVLTFGMSIAQSVVEEKQSRVIELLVAALPVRWLLTGKVLGNTVMALGQIVVILGAGLAGATLAGQGQVVSQVLGASGWFVAFFLLGFVMLACLWAVAGSLASRIEDLQATTVVMQVLVIVPFFAALFAMEPGPVQRVLSYVPFTAPLLMPARVVLGNAAAWEPVVSASVVLLTGVVFVLVGARLYEGSLLHTSSRLKAMQAWRAGR
ncbi:ABC transporter permease [Isoptericola sp. b441]|uniref:ABC transporter permease n=1 Tax=Actinotalea lenta TaxID=3064654 RepID=A0ABT9D587_9CELL|nr:MULTISPECIES: ABC transporter permease [unclassified Isoptericola]MDO8105922.1 ABC transporter permease [Isoptericola sp. b441]MDO8122637.1 ABC transporter permease [Isoptericola sp. b490]